MEILSPGERNEHRDSPGETLRERAAKLKLYSIHGVQEYWIVNWEHQTLEIYRRHEAQLHRISTLIPGDTLTSPLLPGFSCAIADLF